MRQQLLGKSIITKWGISIFIGILVASAAFFFTQHNTLNVKDSDIIYVKKGPIAPGIMHFSHTLDGEFSFFINVYITQKQGQRGSFIVMRDRINKISFLILPDGIPFIQWKSKKLLPSRKRRRSITRDRKVSPNQWNHVGFTYKNGKLSTFVNGHKCWEILTKIKKFTLSHLELLPKKDNAPGVNGKATYPILLARTLSLQHILDLYNDSRLYDNLLVKIFFLFLFGFLFAYFALFRLFLPFISLRGSIPTMVSRMRHNVLFVLSVHFIFFLVFNPGYYAAQQINIYFGKHGLWNYSAYFTLLVVIGLAFLLWIVLGKITRTPGKIVSVYIWGIMPLLMFTFILCLLPRFNHIYPFVFNGLFSLLFSLVVAAPDILGIYRTEVDDEIRKNVHQA